MFTYRNLKTGQVVHTTCRVKGKFWELMAETAPKAEKTKKKGRPAKGKKEENTRGGDDG